MSQASCQNLKIDKVEPILVGISDAAKMLSISRGLFYEMISDGRLGPVGIRFGRKRLFSVGELRRWVDASCPCREKWLSMQGTQYA